MKYTLASKHSQSESEKQRCSECGSTNLVYDFRVGEVACSNCGLVLYEIVDRGPEWRGLDDEKKRRRTRVGAPSTYKLHDKGLSTAIDKQDRDAHGRPIPSRIKADFYRLRKWHSRACFTNPTERNIALALTEIFKLCNRLFLPENVAETASLEYQKLVKKRSHHGRERSVLVAAAVYLGCRRCGVPRTLKEIAEAANIHKEQIGKGYRFMLEKLEYQSPLQRPKDYISKILNPLGITGKTEETAHKILEQAREARIVDGKGPDSLAAAACYAASVLTGERVPQREIAEVIKSTEVTIRNRCRDLKEKLLFDVYL